MRLQRLDFHPITKQIRAIIPTQVRVAMRAAAFHEGSDEAVQILETALMQNLFEPVLNATRSGQPESPCCLAAAEPRTYSASSR